MPNQLNDLESALAERDAARAQVAERDAVIAAMRAIVTDPVVDYYGELRVWFNALATSPADALEAVKATAWDEGYTIGNRHDGRRDANPYRA